jgi:uncharacterized membrane protein (UPF0127 family)
VIVRGSALTLVASLALACASLATSVPGGASTAVERAEVVIRTKDGRRIELRVEIARTTLERGRGLMGRRTLARDAGMLFVYPKARRGSFWMRGTHIPLAIAFMDARGRILRMLRMEPCHADPCPLYDPGIAYRSALEVNAGSFARWRVRRGDTIRLVRR